MDQQQQQHGHNRHSKHVQATLHKHNIILIINIKMIINAAPPIAIGALVSKKNNNFLV